MLNSRAKLSIKLSALLGVAVACAAGLVPPLTSLDAILGGVMTFLVTLIIEMVILRASIRLRLGLRVAYFIATAMIFAVAAIGSKARGFERAFGVPLPREITDLALSTEYAGGPGDQTTRMTFTAPSTGVPPILKNWQPAESSLSESEAIEIAGKTWHRYEWDIAEALRIAREEIGSMKRYDLRVVAPPQGGAIRSGTLFLNPATRRVAVLFCEG